MFGSRSRLQKHEKQKIQYNPQLSLSKTPSLSSSPAFQSCLQTPFRPFSQQLSLSKTPFPPFNPQVSLSKTPFRPFLASVHDNSSSSTPNHEQSSQSQPYRPVLHQLPPSSQETPPEPVSTECSSGRTSFESTLNAENNQLNEYEDEEVEIIDTNGNIIRKQRMTTKDVSKLITGEKVLVHVNGFDQPIRSAGSLCIRFMGRLLKQQRFCPIEAKDWREVKKGCGVSLMKHIREKFSLPERENVDRVLFLILGNKYRARKYRVKDKLFKSVTEKLKEADNIGLDDAQEIQYTEEQILEGLDLVETPANINHYQWNIYKDHLRSSELKKLSELGKMARGEQLHAHTTGARSHARIRDEFMLKNNREPYPLEFFDIVYKTKEGAYVKNISKDFMDMANEEVKKRILNLDDPEYVDTHKRSKIEREVVMELIGPDKPGRARFHGKGVTKSQVTDFSYDLRRMRSENSTNNHVGTLLVQLESQRQQLESQNKQIQFQNQKIETQDKQIMSLHQTVDDFRGELRLFQSIFQDSYADGRYREPHVSRENMSRTQFSSRASQEESGRDYSTNT